ncbi:hypothetical protein CVT24_007781 [Panaeolus cyanescens]|uniref:Uncharacterized protein n=1 Tax=Panaeolus cyanescens TaxID=181874 RepID=A0A409YKS8_9AGAR|nr:hypothetical protein CVT24_007781 [Panaeolus cyanescens]
MQTRSQTRQILLQSLRTRSQVKSQQPPTAPVAPRPIRTVSKKRKPQQKSAPTTPIKQRDDDGIYIHTTSSATGKGSHIRWEYPAEELIAIESFKYAVKARREHIPSYGALFEGSLSSISSDESSIGSGSFSSIQSGPPHTDFTSPHNSYSEYEHSTIPSRPLSDISSTRPSTSGARRKAMPLERTSAHQWDTSFEPSVKPKLQRDDAPSFFNRELAKMAAQGRILGSVERGFENDFASDAMSTTDTEIDHESHSQGFSAPARLGNGTLNRLGPCGTELIDDGSSGRAEVLGYPPAWVSRQSTHLTNYPTEQDFGMNSTST